MFCFCFLIYMISVLVAVDQSLEEDRQKLLLSMRNFRPNNTIFEINSTKKSEASEVMKVKRGHHGHVIAQNERKMAEREEKEQEEEQSETAGGDKLAIPEEHDEEELKVTHECIIILMLNVILAEK